MDSFKHYLAPFYTLQYPTPTPPNTDSFHDSPYYNVGKLDICIVFTMIVIMAVLRDAFRLLIFEPFARWKLTRDLSRKRRLDFIAAKSNGSVNGHANGNGHSNGHANGHANGNSVTNGKANGNGHSNGHINGDALPPPTTKELRQLNHKVLRFAEQGWSVVYYTVQWCFGVYIHYNLPTKLLDPIDLWVAYPHRHIAAPVKIYYLTQNAFYMHQIFVINAEARRKDHLQMMFHHVITVVLMLSSYFTNFTRIGSVIMVLMDSCDIFLPLAKMIRYLEISQLACDMTFGIFMVTWLITRHFLFNIIIYSTFFVGPKYLILEWDWDWNRGIYVNSWTYLMFCFLLVALQLIQCVWFAMICRVAWRMLTTEDGAKDNRSDEEDDPSDLKED